MGVREIGSIGLQERTLRLWQSRTRRRLSKEDAREMTGNVVGFFRVLDDWRRAADERLSAPEKGGEL